MPKLKNHNKFIELFLEVRASVASAKPGSPLIEADAQTLLATERALSSMAELLNEFGDEMTAAVKVAAAGEGSLNEQRNLDFSLYHRARVSHLSEQIEGIDAAMTGLELEPSSLSNETNPQLAELRLERRDKQLLLKDHRSKLSNRNHGVKMTSMRSKRH